MKNTLLLGLVAIAFVLAGCSTKEPVPVTTAETKPTAVTPPAATGGATTTTTPTAVTTPVAVNPLKDPSNILSKRVIYFDYDMDSLKGEYQAIVQAHAKFLSENRGRKIRLEGHADERGSREYNMALGQRRADAVRKASNLLGVANERMESVSFGEDKPRATGGDEAAWSQNRRVEIVYDGE